MFTWDKRDDAAAVKMAYGTHGEIFREQSFDRLRRGNADCNQRKRLEFLTDRRDLLYALSRGSYQRTSGPASYNGKCRPYQTAYINRAKRAGTGSKCPARDRTGAAVPD